LQFCDFTYEKGRRASITSGTCFGANSVAARSAARLYDPRRTASDTEDTNWCRHLRRLPFSVGHFVMEPQMPRMNADTLRRQLRLRLSTQSAVLPQGASAERLPRKLSGFQRSLANLKLRPLLDKWRG